MNQIADEVPDPRMIMFLDKAARNQRLSQWPNGWALLGRRCVQKQFFVRGECYSILPVLMLDVIIMYDIIPGSVTAEHFMQFLQQLVVSWDCEESLELLLIFVAPPDLSNQCISWSSQCDHPQQL